MIYCYFVYGEFPGRFESSSLSKEKLTPGLR